MAEHKPGCDALGGYGHGVGACTCGAAQQSGPSDAQMLDWLERQDMNELTFGMFHDQPHDGEYCIHPGDAPYYGRTLRGAIRAAMKAKGGV